MSHAVPDEGEPPLQEEHPDHRGADADEQGGQQRPLHEVQGE